MPVCAQHLSHKHQKGGEWNSGPNEGPGSLGITFRKGRIHHRFPLTLTHPQWALLDFLQFLLNCHLTGSQGRKENRWEKFLMHMDWYLKLSLCPGMGVLQAESPIPVWEAGSSLPEETCLVLQGEVTSLPSHLFWKRLIGNKLTLQWVPGAVILVLPLLSEGETFCPTPGTPGRGCSCPVLGP